MSPTRAPALEILDPIPRLGWVNTPTPVDTLPELARERRLRWLGVKRDDGVGTNQDQRFGSTKIRKLDTLLASPSMAGAAGWISVGAIGSGHLVALVAAADRLGFPVQVRCFWEPLSVGVMDNLAFTASGSHSVRFYPSRLSMVRQCPWVLREGRRDGWAIIPPGATTPVGMLGVVRAGVELAHQIGAGLLPRPDRIVVPVGTGGTLAGLAVGLGLAGLRPLIHGVTVVERPLFPGPLYGWLARQVKAQLVAHGVREAGDLNRRALPPVRLDRRQLGAGYGVPTEASARACQRLAPSGIDLEPVYSGKAMAAVLADDSMQGERVLFWQTPRRAGRLPCRNDWRTRLPRSLTERLAYAERLDPVTTTGQGSAH